jgi:hypothetical protein
MGGEHARKEHLNPFPRLTEEARREGADPRLRAEIAAYLASLATPPRKERTRYSWDRA